MKRSIASALLCGLAACSTGTDVPNADKAVAQFHKMLDAGQFAQIWQASAPDMKNATSEPKLVQLLAVVHRKLGTVRSAQQQGWNNQYVNGSHLVTLNYATHYTSGDATEQFVYRFDDGRPKLAGYHINSDALILD